MTSRFSKPRPCAWTSGLRVATRAAQSPRASARDRPGLPPLLCSFRRYEMGKPHPLLLRAARRCDRRARRERSGRPHGAAPSAPAAAAKRPTADAARRERAPRRSRAIASRPRRRRRTGARSHHSHVDDGDAPADGRREARAARVPRDLRERGEGGASASSPTDAARVPRDLEDVGRAAAEAAVVQRLEQRAVPHRPGGRAREGGREREMGPQLQSPTVRAARAPSRARTRCGAGRRASPTRGSRRRG